LPKIILRQLEQGDLPSVSPVTLCGVPSLTSLRWRARWIATDERLTTAEMIGRMKKPGNAMPATRPVT